ncbi:hypothetical protein JTB14_008771 [Gonioctena quinquepunctata]|nr:hypothetical protein JTB14_008771 [Gonioctena quinquepunctata]
MQSNIRINMGEYAKMFMRNAHTISAKSIIVITRKWTYFGNGPFSCTALITHGHYSHFTIAARVDANHLSSLNSTIASAVMFDWANFQRNRCCSVCR